MGLLEECVTCGLGFWAYELGQSMFAEATGRSPTPGERGCIGGLTAMANMSVTLPLVLVQRRMQVGPPSPAPLEASGIVLRRGAQQGRGGCGSTPWRPMRLAAPSVHHTATA